MNTGSHGFRKHPARIRNAALGEKCIPLLSCGEMRTPLHVVNGTFWDPLREVTFETGVILPRFEFTRRLGRPRFDWLTESLREAHEHFFGGFPNTLRRGQHLLFAENPKGSQG